MTEVPLLCKDLQCDLYMCLLSTLVFPSGSAVKNPPANAGEVGSIPGSGRSPGEGNGNPLQCSYLENSMDSCKESDTTEQLSLLHHSITVTFSLFSCGGIRISKIYPLSNIHRILLSLITILFISFPNLIIL